MKIIRLALAVANFCLTFSCGVWAQEPNGLVNECDSLQNAKVSDLVQLLNSSAPDYQNGDCLAWAIRKVGDDRYEPAIPALIKLLDFRRPPTGREKSGFVTHPQGIWDLYPATGALSLIGKKALPEILRIIESDSADRIANENAIFVWMEIYRRMDAQPQGIRALKEEQANAHRDRTKQRLAWTIERAVMWCNPSDQAACVRASAGNP